MTEKYQAPQNPVWWTNASLKQMLSCFPHVGSLRALCIKRKTWFEAKQILGGHPKKLTEVAEEKYLKDLMRALEKGKKPKCKTGS